MTLSPHLDLLSDYRYWLEASNCSSRTVGARLDGARRLLLAADRDPSALTMHHVLRYIASVESAWSRVTYYQHAVSFHAFLTARGDAPAFMAGVRKPRTPRGVPKPINRNELTLAILAAPVKAGMMLRLAAYAGLRVSEIAIVRGEDIDRSIFVAGKGGREDWIPTHPSIKAAAEAFPSTGWWFPNRYGEPVGRVCVWKNMTDALRLIGSTATPHQVRHFYGTSLLEAGVDLRTVQVAMRHASLSTTALYTRVTDERLRAAVTNLPTLV